MLNSKAAARLDLTKLQEFSIEIPDKEADAIHSSTFTDYTALLPY